MDRRNVDPVVSGTPGGAQGRSSWEGGAPKAQYRPKAGKKKKTHEVGLFFLVPTSPRCFIRKWVNPTFPDPVGSIDRPYSLANLSDQSYTWKGVDRQGFGQVRPIVGAGS